MALEPDEIRKEMFFRINQAQVQHDLLVSMQDFTKSEADRIKFNLHLRFFASIESALFNSVIVLLYALYETRFDTINFHRLVDSISELGDDEKRGYADRLTEIKPTWIRVNMLRNNIVGHQSLDRPRTVVEANARVMRSDVDDLLDHARRLLFDISCRHFDTHLDYMEDTRTAVRTLFDHIQLPSAASFSMPVD